MGPDNRRLNMYTPAFPNRIKGGSPARNRRFEKAFESCCTHEGTVPYRSSAQMSCREEVGVSFVALEILEPQTARH
jgi:hypothetical protein